MSEPMAHGSIALTPTPVMNGSHQSSSSSSAAAAGAVQPWSPSPNSSPQLSSTSAPTPPSPLSHPTNSNHSQTRGITDSPQFSASASVNLGATHGKQRGSVPFKNPFLLSFDRSFSEDEQTASGSSQPSTPSVSRIDENRTHDHDNNDEQKQAATIASTRKKLLMMHARSRSAADLSTDLELEIATGPEGQRRVTQSRSRMWSAWATRILASRNFIITCIILGCLNLFLFIYSLAKWGSSGSHSVSSENGWYIALDVIVSLAFFCEIALRIIAQPKTYFDSCLNLFDLIIMLFCVLALFMYVFDPDDARMKSIVLVVRYLAQMARLYGPLKKLKEGHITQTGEAIQFDTTQSSNPVTPIPPTIDGTADSDNTTLHDPNHIHGGVDDGTHDTASHTTKENMHAALFLRGVQDSSA